MFTVTAYQTSQTLRVTGTIEEAIAVAKQQPSEVSIYDEKNRLLYEWSPFTGLKSFLVD